MRKPPRVLGQGGKQRRKGIKSLPGWPKRLPCLGFCGQTRMSTGPEDRFCSLCRIEKRRRDEWVF